MKISLSREASEQVRIDMVTAVDLDGLLLLCGGGRHQFIFRFAHLSHTDSSSGITMPANTTWFSRFTYTHELALLELTSNTGFLYSYLETGLLYRTTNEADAGILE